MLKTEISKQDILKEKLTALKKASSHLNHKKSSNQNSSQNVSLVNVTPSELESLQLLQSQIDTMQQQTHWLQAQLDRKKMKKLQKVRASQPCKENQVNWNKGVLQREPLDEQAI